MFYGVLNLFQCIVCRQTTMFIILRDKKRSGKASTTNLHESVNTAQAMFEGSPKKSVRQGARESGLTGYTLYSQ